MKRSLRFALLAGIAAASGCMHSHPPKTAALPRRDLTLDVQVQVADVPRDAAKLVMWIPVPRDESVQVLHAVAPDDAGGKTSIVVDQAHGNPALRVEIPQPPAAVAADVRFEVSRVEERSDELRGHPFAEPPSAFAVEDAPAQWLKDDGLTKVTDEVKSIASKIYTAGMTDDQKARAAFDYVLANMTYKKEGSGWGTGSTEWACSAKYGNCTDFHALFISLLRAGGVPARFRIGFPVPQGPAAGGAIAGYHCWAEYHSAAHGWVPVDASEAWKHPEKRDYLFGTLDPDRVGMSLGRDVTFDGQAGPALNYFVWPYAEIDGKPVKVEATVSWSEKR